MKKKGFTMIELIVSMAILLIISGITLDICIKNTKELELVSNIIDKRANTRIALDFIIDHMRTASVISTSINSVTIDGHRVYLKNNILRYDYDSEQVACNITGLSITSLGNLLYVVKIVAEDYSQTTFVNIGG